MTSACWADRLYSAEAMLCLTPRLHERYFDAYYAMHTLPSIAMPPMELMAFGWLSDGFVIRSRSPYT